MSLSNTTYDYVIVGGGSSGVPHNEGFCINAELGIGRYWFNIHRGIRQSTYRAYIKGISSRSTLTSINPHRTALAIAEKAADHILNDA